MTPRAKPGTHALARDDMWALRRANSVTFRHTGGEGRILAVFDGDAPLTLRLQGMFPEPHDDGTRSRAIPATSSIHSFGDLPDADRWTERTAPHARCATTVHTTVHEPWHTTATLLRIGDRLHLAWTGSDDTQLLTQYDLHHDRLNLVVRRGTRRLTFAVNDQVSHNDPALRMIRRHG